MSLHAGGLEIRIHPLVPLSLLVMAELDAGWTCLWAFGCMLLHEMGHLLAARLLGLQALSLEVMPFGGALHIGGLYRLQRGQLAAVALAGPAVSLLLAALCAQIPSRTGAALAAIHLGLGLFNLLPGLPLDGGRVLAALLRPALGVRRSVRVAVALGRGIGAALLACAALGWITRGRLPFPLALSGVFLLARAGGEKEACELSPAEDVLRMMQVNRLAQMTPVQAVACPPQTPARELLRALRPDRLSILLWLDGEGNVQKWSTDRQWLREWIGAGEVEEER